MQPDGRFLSDLVSVGCSLSKRQLVNHDMHAKNDVVNVSLMEQKYEYDSKCGSDGTKIRIR